jgi:hypothetical protein
MNTTNPFQVPSCFQIDHERRRRERFKRTFIAVVTAGVLLLIGLLIEGCMSEHTNAAAPASPMADSSAPPSNTPVVATEPMPVTMPEPNSQPAVSQSVSAVPKANISPAAQLETIHVVKAGDTLARIARAHGTTVRAIETANGLASDRIAVGTKLKLPEI